MFDNIFHWKSPYVKPVDDSGIKPVIPSEIEGIKVCRYRATKGKWQHLPQKSLEKREPPTDVRLITWCLDWSIADPEDHLAAALTHIAESLGCAPASKPPPCVICLQEVHASALAHELVQNAWVRAFFCVLPHTADKWPEGAEFGNVTLVSRDVPVEAAAVLRFGHSAQKRTAIIAHLWLRAARVREGATEPRLVRVAVINTQLESDEHGPTYRPQQLELLSQFLRTEGVNGGVIAGDLYPMSRSDRQQPEKLGLKDAWKRGDDDEDGFTCFDKSDHPRIPPARFDKLLFLPRRGLKVDEPTRIGMDLTCDGAAVSEHCGLMSTLHMLK